MIGVCDCNNFFVSCQRVFSPEFEEKPAMVLSGNDGCVIARSNEVKNLGIKMGVPLFQVKDLVKRHNIKLFSANHELYADMSSRVMDTLRELTPCIEVYSIDESFIDFSGFDVTQLKQHTEMLAHTIKQRTGIPVSIGIAPTKTLAKIASKLCKQYPRLNNSCLMYRQEDVEKVLSTYELRDVWGLGRKSVKKLNEIGVYTAIDFVSMPEHSVRQMLHITGLRIWRELKGISSIDFMPKPSASQSMSLGRTFAKSIESRTELRKFIVSFASTLAEKLRREKQHTRSVTTYICTNRHRDDLPQHNDSHTEELSIGTNSTLELVEIVTNALEKIHKEGYAYKKAGIICTNLSNSNAVQQLLFDKKDRSKHKRLMQSVDRINSQLGNKAIRLVSEVERGIDVGKYHKSQCFTTNWDELPIVRTNSFTL